MNVLLVCVQNYVRISLNVASKFGSFIYLYGLYVVNKDFIFLKR
jgi:hypothetical protein